MNSLKNSVILFDLNHNEILDIFDTNFSSFFSLLKNLGLKIEVNQNKNITSDILEKINFLVLGNPIDDYFSNLEIKNIIRFVRTGGRLLLISEYGSDYVQKTNLNDIGQYFGIKFNKNVIKEENSLNHNCSSILTINNFSDHKIVSQLRELRIGGSCSLSLNKNSIPLFFTNGSWTENYNEANNLFSKNNEDGSEIIATCSEYGQGKIIALGDVDIFTNDSNFGLNVLDNRDFILNCFSWYLKAIKKSDVTLWTLNQLGTLHNELKEMNQKVNNIIESLTLLELRIRNIENTKKMKNKKEIEQIPIEKNLF